MNLQATKELLAELRVLTNVHHTNLASLMNKHMSEDDSRNVIVEKIDSENGAIAIPDVCISYSHSHMIMDKAPDTLLHALASPTPPLHATFDPPAKRKRW